jgi:hypothetical protein
MERLTEDKFNQWDAFVQEALGGTVFHNTWYLQAWSAQPQVHVLLDSAGKIKAGICISERRFMGTDAVRRPMWTACNGPLIRASAAKTANDRASEEKSLMMELMAQVSSQIPLGIYDFFLPPEYADMMPFIWSGYDICTYYTYQIPPSPPEVWQSAMRQGHRRDLQKAWKVIAEEGGSVEESTSLDECYQLFRDTVEMKNINLSFNFSSLNRWWQILRAHRSGKIFVAREKDGRPVCATIMISDNRSVFYLASGIRKDARHGPLSLWSRALIDRMIRDAHSRGLIFDFEGSVLQGVEQFFRGWGGRRIVRYRVLKIPSLLAYMLWTAHRFRLSMKKVMKPTGQANA